MQQKKVDSRDYEKEILGLINDKTSLSAQEITTQLNGIEKDILVALRSLLSEEKISLNKLQKFTKI